MYIVGCDSCNLQNKKDIYKQNVRKFLLLKNRPRINTDTISFKKQYSPHERGMEEVSTSEIMAHNYLDLRRKNWGSSVVYDGLSPHNIANKLRENFLEVMTKLGLGVNSDPKLVDWKTFLTLEYKKVSCDGVNKARSDRLKHYWNTHSVNINTDNISDEIIHYIDLIKNNHAYQFLALLIAFNDIKNSNRHIPLPFDIEVLAKTFYELDKNREILSIDKLSNIYHSNLIENALINNPEKIIHINDNDNLSNMDECWVRIEGMNEESKTQNKLINLVEIFSNKNWCTHSREDKARAQVETGDFYVYLKKDKDNNWQPLTAISTNNHYIKKYVGVIEIQGTKNNYILSDDDYKRIKILLKKIDRKVKFKDTEINKHTPSAYLQMEIMKYLEKDSPIGQIISKIRHQNEELYTLREQVEKCKERISLLKPSNNLRVDVEARQELDEEIDKLKEERKNAEEEIKKINDTNKNFYYKLLKHIGATPKSDDYSVIDTLDVLNKFLFVSEKMHTLSEIDSGISIIHDDFDNCKLEEKTYPTIASTKVTIPINLKREDFNKRLLLNQIIHKFSKIDLNEVTTSKSLLSLGTYNPLIDIDYNTKIKRRGSQVPLMYFGIDEDALLKNVKSIDIFYMRNSGLKKFPKNLSKVNELYCNSRQYNTFRTEIEILKIKNPQMKIVISAM